MDNRLGDLHGMLALCDRIMNIFREARVVGRQIYHPATIVDFVAEPKSGLVLIWRLNYLDNHASRVGELLPCQLEVSLWNDGGDNSEELIKFLYTVGCGWGVVLTFEIDRFQAVHDLVFRWSLIRGATLVDEHKALELIESLAEFYAKLSVG